MKTSSRGATFIELLVVMAIIAIFSSFTLANWRSGEKQYALQRAANKFAQDVRRVEGFALSSRETQNQVPKGGYGVYLNIYDPGRYILFADLNNNRVYDSGELVEDVKIEKDIQIKQLSSSSLTITFLPPDPTVLINNDQNVSSAQIVFSIKTDETKTKAVNVNKLGLIYMGSQISPPPPPSCYANGTSCSWASQCCSGYCVDGYCCNSACSGSTCQTCGPYSSQGVGACGPAQSNSDPDSECGTTGCLTGNCSGSSYACGYYTSGQHNCSSGYICNASGNCVPCLANGTVCLSESECCSGYCYVDTDGDRYSPSSGTKTCRANTQLSGTDCNDNNASIYPGTTCSTACQICQTNGSCVASSDTNWGANLYGCSGSSKRCYGGTCRTCSGYLYSDGCSGCAGQGGNACWRAGGDTQTCNTACASYGGCVQQGWEDTGACTVMNALRGCGACYQESGGAYPSWVYYVDEAYWRCYRGNATQNCAYIQGYGYYRPCVCRY